MVESFEFGEPIRHLNWYISIQTIWNHVLWSQLIIQTLCN